MTTCKHNPNRHEKDPTQSTLHMGGDGVVVCKFDPEVLREAFAEMVIEDEQPFSMAERSGMRKFMAKDCPRFTLPSRRTCTRGAVRKYFEQKAKLKQFFRQHGDGVCLTTDCWTSKKQDGYMTVTAHFIDNEWQQHKKLIAFFKVKGHKGEDIGKNLQRVMNEWGMQKVITVIVGNASNNDTALNYLRKQMVNANTSIASGKYLHMRCAAHIVNLIVSDGLKEVDLSVQRVRAAVRYIKNGTNRMDKFHEVGEDEKIDSDAFMNLDVCTRWNSTYLILKAALVYEKLFVRFAEDDANYVLDLSANGGVGHPDELDWHKVQKIAEFLKRFYDLTVRVSSSLHVTANSFFVEIGEVHILVKKWLESKDDLQKEMGKRMKDKYNKYWGMWHENNRLLEKEKGKEKEKENINLLIFVSAAIDPRYKLTEYLELAIEEIFGNENGPKVWVAVTTCFHDMFDEYMNLYAPPSDDATLENSGTQQNEDAASVGGGMMKELIAKRMKLNNGGNSRISIHKSELDKYLAEDCEDPYKKLDVLAWWKLNATRFPILACLARDVLSIPISTVASESAFSIGGRVLDDFRTSLTPFMVEALVCTQDWL